MNIVNTLNMFEDTKNNILNTKEKSKSKNISKFKKELIKEAIKEALNEYERNQHYLNSYVR